MSLDIKFIQDIFKGASFIDNEHFQSVQNKFLQNLSLDKENVKEKYGKCISDLQRIELFEEYFEWKRLPQKYFERFQKSETMSSSFREVGNRAYKAQDISYAFRGYNLALTFAPTGSEEEGLAYSNRSALLMFIKEFKKAICDLELALEFNLNEAVQNKLKVRKAKCEDSLTMDPNGYFNKENEGKDFCANRLEKLKSESLVLKGAEDCVKIEFSPECGRRLVATKDISAGTTIIVDYGYATVLEKLLNWDTEHCAYCTNPILAGIPNPLTTFGLYCNRACLDEALTSVSKYEEKYLSYIHSTPAFHDESLLILRVLSKTGSHKLYDLWSTGKFNKKNPTVYDPTSYLSVHNLISHQSSPGLNNYEDLTQLKEFKAIFLTNILDSRTDFFQNFKSEAVRKFKTFLSSLILRHFESLEFNVLSLCEWRTTQGPLSQPIWTKDAKLRSRIATTSSYGTGVFPAVALCNHSCDPNAIFVKGTKVNFSVLLSSRIIYKGDEILISYKAPFTRMSFQERQDYLLQNYKFICKCFACGNQFSADSMQEIPNLLKKQEENSKFSLKRLIKTELQLELAKNLIKDERFLEAFDLLVEQGNFLSNFQSNFKLVQICQDLFRTVVVHIMHL